MDLFTTRIYTCKYQMDEPKTRKETKKDQKEKAKGKSIYTSKHVRITESLKEKQTKHK